MASSDFRDGMKGKFRDLSINTKTLDLTEANKAVFKRDPCSPTLMKESAAAFHYFWRTPASSNVRPERGVSHLDDSPSSRIQTRQALTRLIPSYS
jgi:hypothetical protein